MADVNARIGIDIDASDALAQLKALQRQLSQFHTSIARSSDAAAAAQRSMQKNLIDSVNSLGGFSAELRTVRTTAESFTNSLEKNKFSMREYFRYAAASTKTFGSVFRSEFDTIGKVAEDRVKKLQTQYIKMGRDANGAMRAIAIIPDALNLDDNATKLQLAAQRQQIFNQLVRQGSTNLLNFGKNTQWAGRQLMVGFTIPLMTLGSVASRTFMEMETAALKFRKVYGDLFTPKAETQAALDGITELGRAYTKYGISVAQTVGLAAEAAAAGFQGADLQRQTEQATRLSILGQVDQQKALETTISLQNAFRMSSEELADAINFLNAVENQTVTSLDDVTTAIPKAAPVIQQLGGDVRDLAFLLTAMREGGINASEGANALKSGLASIINPTSKASDMLATMGINIDKIVESNRGNLRATVVEFATAMNQLDPLARARAIEQLFGKFQFARISTLLQNVTQTGNQADRVLSLASSSVQELADLSAQELGMTAESAMNKFKGAVEDLRFALMPLGETFLTVLTPIVDMITGLLDRFNNLSDGTKRIIAGITLVLGGIGPIALMAFGLLANGLANIIKLGLNLRNAFLKLTGQSRYLGETTQYLTSEQLEASAAAASLDQAHANLTQRFTVEASAVDKLREAYLRAINASNQFAMANPGMMIPGRIPKFARGGIIQGPGSGTSDSIIAKVSNGEAIIPAKSVSRNPELVNALVTGNIPGFADGLGPNIPNVRVFTNAVTLLQRLTNARLNAGGVSAGDLSSEIRAGGAGIQAPIVRAIAESLGASNVREIRSMIRNNPEIRLFAERLSTGIADEVANTGGRITDPQFSKIYQDVARREAARSGFGPQVEEFLTKPTTFEDTTRTRQSSRTGRVRSMGRAQIFEGIRSYRTTSYGTIAKELGLADIRGLVKAHVTGPIITSFKDLARSGKGLTKAAREAATRQVSAIEKGAADALQVASPSKRTRKVGQAAGDGIVVGASEKIDDARVVGQKIGEAAVQGVSRGPEVESAFPPRRRQSSRSAGPSPYLTIPGFGTSVRIPEGTRTLPLVSERSLAENEIKRIQAETNALAQETRKTTRIFRGINPNMTNVSFGLSSLSGMLMMTTANSESAFGRFNNMLFKASTALMTFSMINNMVPGGIAGRVIGRARSARQAAAFASYGASAGIGGIAGRVAGAGSGLPGVLGRVVPLFGRLAVGIAKFLGPWGLAISAISAGFSLWKLYNKKQEEARQKIEGLGNAAKLSEEKLKTLGDIFGVTPTKGRFARQRESKGTVSEILVSNPERAKVEELKASEDFQNKFAKDIETLKSASDRQATIALESISRQLIGSGFSADMVKSIITAIQEEAGKTNIVIDFGNIDLSSEKGMETLKASLDKMAKEFSSSFKKGGDAAKRSANLISTSMTNTIESISDQFEQGKIDINQFNAAFAEVTKSIEAMPQPQAIILMSNLMNNLPEDLRSTAKEIDSIAAKMVLLQASALGVSAATMSMAANAAVVLETPGADPQDKRLANEYWNNLVNEMKAKQKIIQSLVNETTPTTPTSGTGDGKLSALQQAVITRYKKEVDALTKKRDALKQVNDELNRQYEFEKRQQELSKSMVEAKISGDYIGAALANQQKLFEKTQFDRETRQLEIDKKIDELNARIDAIEAGGKVTAAEASIAKIKGAKTTVVPKNTSNAPKPTTTPTTTIPRVKFNAPQVREVSLPAWQGQSNNTEKLYIFDTKTGKFIKDKNNDFTALSDPERYITWSEYNSGQKTYKKNFANGGMIKVKKYSMGGLIKGPGTSKSDSILGFANGGPIRLSNNEYVMQAAAVRANGLDYMNAMNSGKIVPGASSNSTTVYNSYQIDVSGVQDPERAADLVMKKLQVASNKTNRTNSVSNNRRAI